MDEGSPQIVQMGYADFWPVIFGKHERFLTVTQTLGPS
jgi:hypothetical protein